MSTVVFRLPQKAQLQQLDDVPVHDIHKADSDRIKTLSKTLSATHRSAAPLRHPEMMLHSHMPHILGSAYYLGASSEQIEDTFEAVIATLDKITPEYKRGDAIAKETYREHIGKKPYTVAFMDFFEDQFKVNCGEWKSIVGDYLYGKEGPLMNGLIGGLGHPVIHLAYAYEYNCPSIASEGMSLLCTDYFPDPGMLEDRTSVAPTYSTNSLLEIISRVAADERFSNILEGPGIANLSKVIEECRTAVMEHLNAWEIDDPLQQLEHACDFATVLAISTGSADKSYDFFLIHLMTTIHAIRVIWNSIPVDKRADMLRAYSLMVILVYICQLRPSIPAETISKINVAGREWAWVQTTALAHPAKFDVHFFKVVRAPKVFAETYGGKDDFYLKASLKFLDEFSGFDGFPQAAPGEFDPRFEGWQAEGKFPARA